MNGSSRLYPPRISALAGKISGLSLVVSALLFGFAQPASANVISGVDTVIIPESSTPDPGDAGIKAHTNVRVMASVTAGTILKKNAAAKVTPGLPPVGGMFYETPASLACIYQLAKPLVAGCNPNTTTTAASGGSRAIAIVDAYDDPSAATDIASFSKQFNLPTATFSTVYATGRRPAMDPTGGWELEEALDIEWAHAMAPGAKIILVEAASANLSDLLTAVTAATAAVNAAGGGEVSMSWGGSEFQGEQSYDQTFSKSGVVFVASAGDSPGTEWPSVSPNVVSAGGTSTSRNPVTGAFAQQTSWQVTGGGVSAYETRPTFQSSVSSTVGAYRGVPDIAFDADPATGVWVIDENTWYVVGGTSVAAPSLAGVINAAGKFNASSAAELTQIYGKLGSAALQNVTGGSCGPYAGYQATTGYNLCTGVGSPLGLTGF
jgi:subtilase family serine protease